MAKNCLLALTLALAALTAAADTKMTVRNADTGDSFEVSVPKGLKIYEVNRDWLDSVPYLVEHARCGERWAYRALGDCHRYGKGGVTRSFANALNFYELAGVDERTAIERIREVDNEDPIVVYSRLIGYVEKKDSPKIESAIDSLHMSGYHSADILLDLIHGNDSKLSRQNLVDFISDDNTDTDACILAVCGLQFYGSDARSAVDKEHALSVIMDKIPAFYSLMGTSAYAETLESEPGDSDADNGAGQIADRRRKAVEYLLKADEHAVLNKKGAQMLYHYCTTDSTSGWLNMSDDDLYRIAVLAGLDE